MTDEQQSDPLGTPAETPVGPAVGPAAGSSSEPATDTAVEASERPAAEDSAEDSAADRAADRAEGGPAAPETPAKHAAEPPPVEESAAVADGAPARHLADDSALEERGDTAERAPRGPGDTAERQPVNAQPPAYVKLHLQGNVLLSMITPKVQIDGYPAPAKYGENLFPVPPGPHVVAAHAQWIWQYGKAQEQVSLAPGETAELWYATPVLTFLPGSMGSSKQRHPGMMVLLLLCGVALAFVVALVIFALGT